MGLAVGLEGMKEELLKRKELLLTVYMTRSWRIYKLEATKKNLTSASPFEL